MCAVKYFPDFQMEMSYIESISCSDITDIIARIYNAHCTARSMAESRDSPALEMGIHRVDYFVIYSSMPNDHYFAPYVRLPDAEIIHKDYFTCANRKNRLSVIGITALAAVPIFP